LLNTNSQQAQQTPRRKSDRLSQQDGIRQEERESRWEAAPAVAVVIALQVALALASHAEDWTTWRFHWWLWLVPIAPEIALLVPLALKRPHRRLEQMGIRREVALTLTGLISAANALLVFSVIASLVEGHEQSGAQLLMKAGCVWATNVIAFALWYWGLDRGGPVERLQPDAPLPDFQFPQMENPQFAPRKWMPQLTDYLYVSFTNSIAFSPTDAMPLTRRAKLLMLAESVVSSLTILLVAARAVNIFK
jgi:uncharacterized membrane protein